MSARAPFAEVFIPLAVEGTFTYAVPEFINNLQPGFRVLVPFGKKRIYTGIVRNVTTEPPEGYSPKSILEQLDESPVLLDPQLQMWDWMSSYYMCHPGEVMRAALPSGLRPESESKVRIRTAYRDDGSLDSSQRLMFEVVKDQGEVAIRDLEITGITTRPLSLLKQLVEKGAVEINEFVRTVVRRKVVHYIRLSQDYCTGKALHIALDGLNRAPRQKELMERYLLLSGTVENREPSPVPRSSLIEKEGDGGVISNLIRKGLLELVEKEESGQGSTPGPFIPGVPAVLNHAQNEALDSVRSQFMDYQTVLLHGDTSSGKTELYIHLIKEQMEAGNQVLYLLPEIALTTQIIGRLKKVFGLQVGVFHSRYSDSERVHVYRNLLGLTDQAPYGVVIGVRSALFLPFRKLGLVVIDEEHETSFKQHDPAPRYHARDSAQVLALFHGAKVLMGTATPSYESPFNARNGKYGYTRMTGRYGEVQAPEILLANTREAMRKKQMVSHFTPMLMEGISQALKMGEQVILFQNRRGYSHYIVCNDCGEIPKCRRCDVSLTYHRISNRLECHYCGHWEKMPGSCRSCSGNNLVMKGFGTEKIEDEISILFEGIRVGRLDTDAARSHLNAEKVIGDFAAGRLDLLVGTQMVSKGLDFENVSLVGVLDADSMMHFPDFRAFERSYQLISQVSGRAGRRKKRGRVIVQTMDPEHPVIRKICRGDYETLFLEQMEERQLFGYPPFTRMIRITFRHSIPSILDGATDLLGKQLKEVFADRVLGPQYPPVRKVENAFIKQIILKIEREASYERAKELLAAMLGRTFRTEVYRSIRVSVDVDPY